jgi:hypothetical protein
MRAADRQFTELVSAYLPRLSAVIPELQQPFYMLAPTRRVAENTLFVDWGFPGARNVLNALRHVTEPDQVQGHEGAGKILWRCYAYWQLPRWREAQEYALYRGFEIRDSLEFHTWLKKRMLDLVHLPAAAGLPALAASLHRQLSPSPMKEARPVEKAL